MTGNEIHIQVVMTGCIGEHAGSGRCCDMAADDRGIPERIRPVEDIVVVPGSEPGSMRVIAIPSRRPEDRGTGPVSLMRMAGIIQITIRSIDNVRE